MNELNKSKRLLSLDVFRGITIAGMLLVNNPGTWSHIFPPLKHAQWHGCTPTDLVFPFFLFIVGVSMSLSFSKRLERGDDHSKLMVHVLRRAVILFALGLIPSLIFKPDLSVLRIPGVLQRIALCYLTASIIVIKFGLKGRAVSGIILLAAYWIIVKLIPVPGFGAGDLSYDGNICGYVDTLLLKGHIYRESFDPEGLISTLPAIVTTLLGVFTGDWIRKNTDRSKVTKGLIIGGIILAASGLFWSIWLPINKKLWTNSYVFYTGGLAMIFLSVCYWLIDIKNYKKWAFPFVVYGTNAITAFVMSGIMARLLYTIRFNDSTGESQTLKTFIYKNAFQPLGSPEFSSMLFALSFVTLWFFLMLILYRKKIFIKI